MRRPLAQGAQSPGGLTYLRARHYDPSLGRFLSKDPFPGLAGDPTTQNGYAYAGNNPTTLSDPSGMCFGMLDCWREGLATVTLISVDIVAGALAATSGGDVMVLDGQASGEIGVMVTNISSDSPVGRVHSLLNEPTAFTVGNFFFSAEPELSNDIIAHEMAHVGQYEESGVGFFYSYARDPRAIEHDADRRAGTTCYSSGCQ